MRRFVFLFTIIIACSTFASAQARCSGIQLRATRESDDAGAGQRYVTYAFTNVGYRPCTLRGYPEFELLNRRGRHLAGSHTEKAPDTTGTVTLSHGEKAWFNIHYSACGVGGEGPCPTSAKVRITAPRTGRRFVLREVLDPFEGTVDYTPVRKTAEQ